MKRLLRSCLITITVSLLAWPAAAAGPKKVVVVTVTLGFRHSSIPTAEKILQKLADESKAFTIVEFARQPEVQVPRRPSKPRAPKPDADEKARAKYAADLKKYEADAARWTPEMQARTTAAENEFKAQAAASLQPLSPANLARIDGVIFANTTGDLPLPDKEGFIQWVRNGGVWIGMHSASDTLHGFAPFIEMIGGEFQTHGAQVAVELLKMDKDHPATRGLPDPWQIAREEMYLFKNYTRGQQRDLWSMAVHPNTKEPGHHPVSWVKQFGKGRIFYTSLGHREDIWDADPNLKDRINSPDVAQKYQQHILGGIKWALGLGDGNQ
ncbi:MAG: ThuA domain-containing protein [Verrucomicrobiota bacterium]|nr:ThuA domain-containing protein [Verrucomicrobiota bacterium]